MEFVNGELQSSGNVKEVISSRKPAQRKPVPLSVTANTNSTDKSPQQVQQQQQQQEQHNPKQDSTKATVESETVQSTSQQTQQRENRNQQSKQEIEYQNLQSSTLESQSHAQSKVHSRITKKPKPQVRILQKQQHQQQQYLHQVQQTQQHQQKLPDATPQILAKSPSNLSATSKPHLQFIVNSPTDQNIHQPAKRPRSCCYTCCCCCCSSDSSTDSHSKASASQRPQGSRGVMEPGDDASHIASLTHVKHREPKGWQICKKFLTFIFSQVGMCAIVVGYSIMGGFLFRWLESSSELVQRLDIHSARRESVSELWNLTEELNILYEKNWTMMADKIFLRFQEHVYQAVKSGGWDGRDVDVAEMKWSFAGSLLYSITVITTIGYGHITPKTDLGKLVTIFYALFGIPLTLLCLSNIGSAFAHCFRFLYFHLCKSLACVGCTPPSTYSTSKSNAKNNIGQNDRRQEMAAYSGVVVYPNSNKASSEVNSRGRGGEILKDVEDPEDRALTSRSKAKKRAKKQPVNVTTEKVNTAEVRVPVTISLIIMALYIFGGAVLFSLWETEWTYLLGAYFCFITLSTIGFGDYVFGVGSDFATNEKTIICALYLVLGLSIIAMCFNLMQEEVRAKSRWLGMKIGIIDDESHGG
ncbi:two pore potassium channel protein sup-9 [Plakobranchus ocellatus]|uniref:Two pore potassium channel protein sup-9 n=1 Tax=Plakobranchus ocellatus TaxID=259542 RepID=A0AAV4DHE6_9GAST|nr:two pore potassium channel protein sup-9 [Plakobranchus ocellatus]